MAEDAMELNSSGYGSGYGYGYGDGSGDEMARKSYLLLVGHKLDAKWVLAEVNAELKREMIEAMGANKFFGQLDCQIVHNDIDGCGHPRSLLRIPLPETERGYLQSVKVVCPTTRRVYYLGVPPNVTTCQEAVASTFGLKPEQYNPERET